MFIEKEKDGERGAEVGDTGSGTDADADAAGGDPNSNSNPRAAEVVQGEVVDEDVVPPASKGIGEETTRVTRVGRRRYTKLRFKGLKGGARPKREDDG